MAATAAKPKAKAPTRAELCRELLKIRSDNGAVFDRIDAINTELKSLAAAAGESFRETFVGVGYVSVSPPSPAKFKGDFPIVNVEAWKALKAARQDKLLEDGVIKIDSTWSKPYYGQVTVKLHNQGAEA